MKNKSLEPLKESHGVANVAIVDGADAQGAAGPVSVRICVEGSPATYVVLTFAQNGVDRGAEGLRDRGGWWGVLEHSE